MAHLGRPGVGTVNDKSYSEGAGASGPESLKNKTLNVPQFLAAFDGVDYRFSFFPDGPPYRRTV